MSCPTLVLYTSISLFPSYLIVLTIPAKRVSILEGAFYHFCVIDNLENV